MATFILILAVSALIPSSLSQCTTTTALPYFKRSVYEFTVDLVKRIAQENENHFISSGLSPWTLISTLSLGAQDETLDEMKRVLRLHHHQCFNMKFFEIVHGLNEARDGTVLERYSSIFASENLAIQAQFTQSVQKTKVSEIRSLNFDDITFVANTINQEVRQATHGNIEDIVDPDNLDGISLVLIDALYFKGSWQNPFNNEETEVSAFYDERGNQIGDVNLMFGEFGANIVSVPQIGATVLELPYGNGAFTMLIMLPENGQTVSSILDNLKKISLKTIYVLFDQIGMRRVSVQIPRFKITSDLDNLKELLVDMGLRSMFENQASFPDLADENLYVSNFIQKASIELTEEGTEASAASAGFLESRSFVMPEQFLANRPFLYMIINKELELILFAGAYSKPSVY